MVVDTSAFDGTDCNVLVLSLFRGTREKVREYLHSIKKKKEKALILTTILSPGPPAAATLQAHLLCSALASPTQAPTYPFPHCSKDQMLTPHHQKGKVDLNSAHCSGLPGAPQIGLGTDGSLCLEQPPHRSNHSSSPPHQSPRSQKPSLIPSLHTIRSSFCSM